jgi:autotransporter passenger strand-loop-strand repeat protein
MTIVSSGAPISSAVVSAGQSITVLSGGIAVSTTILSAGSAFVLAGGSASITSIDSGGAAFVSGGSVYDTTINGGALVMSGGESFVTQVNSAGVEFLSAGTAYSTTVDSGGTEVVSGGAAYDTTVNSDGLLIVSGGAAFSTIVASGGSESVSSGAAFSTTVENGGTEVVSAGETYATTVNSGGAAFVSGGVAYDTTVNDGGVVIVADSGLADNTTIDAGGAMAVQSGGYAYAPLIEASGTLALSAGAGVSSGIEFAGASGLLDIAGTTMPGATIAGFAATDAIDLQDVAPGSAASATFDSATDVLSVSAGGQVYALELSGGFGGAAFVVTGDGGSGSLVRVGCFAAGTRIATPSGDLPVESLSIGQAVLSPWGEAMNVRWLGFRHVDCARHPRPEDVWPVRVRANAFRPGVPARDLFLSPDHAIFLAPPGLRPVLVPVRCLIDGASVTQEQRGEITYWHVELERHAVLLAEGLPCESFLDTGNRAAFANGGPAVQLHPTFAAAEWQARACAPQVRGGPVLDWARALLAERRRAASEPPYLGETGTATSLRRSGGRVQGGS